MKRCNSRKPPIGLLLSSGLLVVAFSILSYGQNAARDDDPHATGYLPPTPEQERYLRETHPRIVKVWPNRLAWTRINEQRKKKGQEPLPEKGFVPRGAEKAFTIGNGPVISGVPQNFVGLELGDGLHMDNSLKACFPEIRTQGSLGSCTNWAIVYYQLTYTAGHDYGWDNKNINNDRKFSPKWTYNMINGGENQGSWPGNAYAVLEKHGAARWSLFPYQTSATDPKSYREWCRDGETWRDAIYYRIGPAHYDCLGSKSFEEWLAEVKTLLANEEVLTFATYISSWQFTTINDDKSTSADDAFVRKPVAYWVSGQQGGHMMTIVGYDDNLWTDINNNRKVDPGEKGALRIANSWGPNWQDSGFCWLAYDALRAQSAVLGGPSTNRRPAIEEDSKVWSINMLSYYSEDPALPYTPTLVAKFKLSHAKRNQLSVALATSVGGSWTPGALQFQGGAYAFDGTSAACEGTFIFDFTDILPAIPGESEYRLLLTDGTTGDFATFFGYKLTDARGYASYEPLDSPQDWDKSKLTASLPYPSAPEQTLEAKASAQPTAGRPPLTVAFSGSGSSGNIYAYKWDFGDGSTPLYVAPPADSSFTAQHVYRTVGTYTARLTVLDENWTEASAQVTVVVRKR